MTTGDENAGRPYCQPRFDLTPPGDEQLAGVFAAVDAQVRAAGFWRVSVGISLVRTESDRLWIRGGWERYPADTEQIRRRDVIGLGHTTDSVTLWGSGLIRGHVLEQSIELLGQGAEPSTLAAMLGTFLAACDEPTTEP